MFLILHRTLKLVKRLVLWYFGPEESQTGAIYPFYIIPNDGFPEQV
jgi:hypothetical protein